MKNIILLFAFFAATATTPALATPFEILSGTVNTDNSFQAYISTSDSVQGTLIGSGSYWGTTSSFTDSLAAGATYYLHIVAVNAGGPGGLLGAFTLSDNQFSFANGSSTLLTGDTALVQNLTGFGNTYNATVSEGVNGASPWGLQSGYGSYSPSWVWNYNSVGSSDYNTVYFSAAINATAAPVPEPTEGALLLSGFGLLAFIASRRKKSA